MNFDVIALALVLVGSLLASPGFAQASPEGLGRPDHLRCEYLTNPLGIERVTPRLSWEMVDARRGAAQHGYQVLVADEEQRLARDDGNLWDSNQVASDQSVHVVYRGAPLRTGQRAYWKVRVWDRADQPSPWSAPAYWTMGLLEAADWGAQWIGEADLDPPADDPRAPRPAPMLRKVFAVSPTDTSIRRATVYATALGLYELRINGQCVSDRILAPEWTDYHKRLQYQTYDVTALVRPGDNAIGVLLGDGWYAGRVGLTHIVPQGPARGIYGRQPRLLLRLELEFVDGRVQALVTDETWRVTNAGPIRVGDLLDGETYDARREQPGWDTAAFDDASWTAATRYSPPTAGLVAQPNEPIRVFAELKPVAVTEPAPGVYVFDLGQNFAGWCRIKLRGVAGGTVTLRHAEVLNPDGTIYTANLRGAAQTDRYTLRGDGEEVFEPHFTYHGFRYVEVSGLGTKPALDALVGRAFCSAAPVAGRFECSDSLLNKLMENILWTQRANMMSVPTDCPQRDERLGWMGDLLAFGQTACFNLDMAAFFTKWLPDVRDAQADDGRYPDFAPHPFDPNVRFSGAPAWGDAGVLVPWCAYVNYGDRRLLEEHFASAQRWVEYVHAQNPDLLWKNGRGNDYGDWLNADTLKLEGWPMKGAEVPKEVFATMFFARSTEVLSKMAAVLGRAEDGRRYARLAADIKAAFQRAYVDTQGRIEGHTQAGYALALNFEMLPEAARPAAARYLLEGFVPYHAHISTGFHSTVHLMSELTRIGYVGESYRLLSNRTMPSWGYAIDHGATTTWERWDGYVEGRGFQDPGMNSFSHYALGSVGEWVYRTVVGIYPDENNPGYKNCIIRPRPGGGLTWASGEYHSLYGTLKVQWRLEQKTLLLDLTIPANTTATVFVPMADGVPVFVGNVVADEVEGISFLRLEDGRRVYRVEAGTYALRGAR